MSTLAPPIRPVLPRARTPLPAVLALSWINSLSASAMTVGIFFITQSAYRFSARDNLLLGLVMGVAYIPGAIGVGPGLRRLAERLPWLSTRIAVAGVLCAMGAAASLPAIFRSQEWIIWPAVAAHLMLSGALWPIMESYLSGGRSGENLRRASARFNICWSTATFAVMWLAAPLVKDTPLAILAIAAALHILSCVVLFAFQPEPGRHIHEEHEPHPPVYTRLLIVFRWLLPTGYMLAYCLSPLMPSLVERAGMEDKTLVIAGLTWSWATPIASAWLLARIGTFTLFERWQGWHGRWSAAWITGAIMLVGFSLAVTASSLVALLIGLGLFGLGLGGVYACALYYALEVGKAEVDAGGMHETLIGIGYTVGPLAGLAGLLWPESTPSGAQPNPWLTVGVASLIALVTVTAAVRMALRTRPA